ncbi:2-phospho-L-lactate guanylyltransferase [Pseudorhodoferax sp.]|uniref:2-phospho-L-lactate guanylyltransferase n=1 Tax=Pseudorhodoferax sp. TaxID=1993553 RepID=UPI0039E6F71A
MNPLLVLPVKSLAGGKSRLALHLAPAQRRSLNAELLARTLALAARFPSLEHTLVVSRCPEVLAMARARGAAVLVEQGCGLNTAVAQSLQLPMHAQDRPGSRVLVLSCDLPLASEQDLRALAAHDGVVLATDRAGTGTNALGLPRGLPFQPHYGPASRQHHTAEAALRGQPCRVLHRPGLAFDLDTWDDYREWQRQPEGHARGETPRLAA